jgi:tetratricopeptide (TPR) repeat protein
MDLERQSSFDAPAVKRVQIKYFYTVLLFSCLTAAAFAQSGQSGKPKLIRDSVAAEGIESADVQPAKERNPALAEQSINIGNFYLKRKNYSAAIQRYLDALEYQPDSVRAWEALARAYEKNGDVSKAVSTYKDFIEKNPDSPKSGDFRDKLADLEKKSKESADHR